MLITALTNVNGNVMCPYCKGLPIKEQNIAAMRLLVKMFYWNVWYAERSKSLVFPFRSQMVPTSEQCLVNVPSEPSIPSSASKSFPKLKL
jgi:hypothetical protein